MDKSGFYFVYSDKNMPQIFLFKAPYIQTPHWQTYKPKNQTPNQNPNTRKTILTIVLYIFSNFSNATGSMPFASQGQPWILPTSKQVDEAWTANRFASIDHRARHDQTSASQTSKISHLVTPSLTAYDTEKCTFATP